jgi:hypothetical protein
VASHASHHDIALPHLLSIGHDGSGTSSIGIGPVIYPGRATQSVRFLTGPCRGLA